MAIVVKHGMNAGPVAAAAFGEGLGAARAPAERGAAQAATALEQQRNSLTAQAAQADASRAHDLERMRLGADLREQAADAAQIRGREDLEFSLTTRQRMELDRLAEAEADLMASSDFTDDEKAEARRMLAAKRAGIQPVARPRPKTAAELFKEKNYVDPKTGAVYPIQADGTFGRPIHEPPERQPTVQDRIKAFEAANTLLAGDGTVTPSPQQVQAVANAILRGEDLPDLGGAAPGAPAAPGAAPGAAGVVAAASAAPAAQPQTIEQRLAKLAGDPASVPRDRALDLDEVNDIATARLQIADARTRMNLIRQELNAAEKGGPMQRLWALRHWNEIKFLEDERLPQLQARERELIEKYEELQAEQIARTMARRTAGASPARPARRVTAIDPQELYELAAAEDGAEGLPRRPPARRIDSSLTPEAARRLGERDRAAFEARRQAMAEERRSRAAKRAAERAAERDRSPERAGEFHLDMGPNLAQPGPTLAERFGRSQTGVEDPDNNSGRGRRRRER